MWLIPIQYRVLAVLMIWFATLMGATYFGWSMHKWRTDAALVKQVNANMEAMKAYDIASRELVKAYQLKQGKTKIVYRNIKGKVNDATTGILCFNSDAVRLYNDSLDGVSSTATGTSNKASTAGASDTEVLNNSIANSEQYKECRDQLNALIDWHEKVK